MKTYLLLLFPIIILFSCNKSDTLVTALPTPVNPPAPANLSLTGSAFILGNREKSIPDSFVLRFNKPLKAINSIRLISSGCLPDIKSVLVNNSTAVSFYNFRCGNLGGDYIFEVSVTDTSGTTLKDTALIKCYTRNLPTSGRITSYFVTEDNKFCWIATASPNQIHCYGLSDTTYKKTYTVSFVPNKLIYNAYNDKIYALPASDDYTNRQNIYVVNMSNGVVEKVLRIPQASLRFPLFASDAAFGKNGFGIIIGRNENSSSGWLIIDSRLNDSIYMHPAYTTIDLKSCYPNADKTKIVCLQCSGCGARLGVLDCATQKIEAVENPLSRQAYNNYIVVNKKNSNIFFGNVNFQYIMFGDVMSTVSGFDYRFTPSSDFTYRNNESYIYYAYIPANSSVGYIQLNDYSGQKTLMSATMVHQRQILSTSDGKYLLAMRENSIVLFQTDIFYKYL